jgi:site-specific DNA-methyltransferase (adenine-specific)
VAQSGLLRGCAGRAGAHPGWSIDLILTDPPYNLGKDYGNASDQQTVEDYLRWTEQWIDAALPKLKPNGSLYIFLTWRFRRRFSSC